MLEERKKLYQEFDLAAYHQNKDFSVRKDYYVDPHWIEYDVFSKFLQDHPLHALPTYAELVTKLKPAIGPPFSELLGNETSLIPL